MESREENEAELSVDHHQTFAQDINWKGGEVVNPGHPVIGAADVEAAKLPDELYVEPDPREGFTTHAEIKGWKTGEDNKSWRVTKCKALARVAQYVPKPIAAQKPVKPTFSIIIPVYNVAPYLRECLDSVLAQTFTDWEVICVDDGSTDGSGAILDEYKEKVEKLGEGGQRTGKIVVIHQKNAGVSAARNAALDVARGEWIGFADADDRMAPDWLASIVTIISGAGYDCIRTGWSRLLEGHTVISRFQRLDRLYVLDAHNICSTLWELISACGYPFVAFYRREIVGVTRFAVGVRMREDALFSYEMATKVNRGAVARICAYHHRERTDSAMHVARHRDDTLRLLSNYLGVWKRLSKQQRITNRAASTCWVKKDVCEWFVRCADKTIGAKLKVWISLWRLVWAGGFNPFAADETSRLACIRWSLYLLTACHHFLFVPLRVRR